MDENFSRSVIIVEKKKAKTILPRVIEENALCYYLAEDYACFVNLQKTLEGKVKIRSLSELFDQTLQEMKEPVLKALASLNQKYDSYAWWGGQMASKSVSASPLFFNIIYFFCAKKLLVQRRENIIFIVDSPALSECILNFSKKQKYQANNYGSTFNQWGEKLKVCLYCIAQVGSFFLKALCNYITSLKVHKRSLAKKSQAKKRIVIRSWVTKDTFSQSGKFKDRNFGHLPQWLRSKGYEVWILPMFFNLSNKVKNKICSDMKNSDQTFLIPEHYLKFSDYIRSLVNGYKIFNRHVEAIEIENVDISPLMNEALKNRGFDVSLCLLNLNGHFLKRLNQKEITIDCFYYALECGAPENQFVLSCRKYFPDADILGYQHTAFFPNQLAHHLGAQEQECHPLPDKIVCSGPIYRDLYKKAKFPQELLTDGPSLRFKSIHTYSNEDTQVTRQDDDKKKLLLPLTFSYNLAYDLFLKVKDAIGTDQDYKVCIRTQPLLSKKVLIDFLDKIDMGEYVFADEGTIQEWLPKTYAVISTGGSVTILEAASFGTPVIRVIPDNTIYYDPFSATSYPLDPVNTSSEISRQLKCIEEIQRNDKGSFHRIAKEVLNDYFTEPNEENLQVFL